MIYEERKAAFDEIYRLARKMLEPEDDTRRQSTTALCCCGTIVLFVVLRCLPVNAPFYIEFPAAFLISVGLVKWRFLNRTPSKTNVEKLDDALSQYEPINQGAFRSLQNDTAESGRLRIDAFRRWREEEKKALKKESGFTATRWNFASQK